MLDKETEISVSLFSFFKLTISTLDNDETIKEGYEENNLQKF